MRTAGQLAVGRAGAVIEIDNLNVALALAARKRGQLDMKVSRFEGRACASETEVTLPKE